MRHANRIAAKKPRRYQTWCGCDCAIISESEKCPVCGVRSLAGKKLRFKKDNAPLV